MASARYHDHCLIFAIIIGTPLDAQNVVNRDFKPPLRRAGLPDIRFHDLRHAAGKEERQPQNRPGHFRACQFQHDARCLQPRASGHEGRGCCGYGQHIFLARWCTVSVNRLGESAGPFLSFCVLPANRDKKRADERT